MEVYDMATILAEGEVLRKSGTGGARAYWGASWAVATLAMALSFGALMAGPAMAKTFTVNSTAHPGNGICNAAQCTLSEAVEEADYNLQADTIAFTEGLKGRIVLHNTATQGGFSIYDDVPGRDLTIRGPGARVLAVDGNDETRPFGVAEGATATISGLTIENGRTYLSSASAGGIGNGGNLTLNRVEVSGNNAYDAIGGGGGVYNTGTLTVNNSTFSLNFSALNGGAIGSVGGPATITDSTISTNTTEDYGGGIDATAPGRGVLTLRNTIVAGNNAGEGGSDIDASTASSAESRINSLGHNLVGNVFGSTIGFVASVLLGRDPLLGPLKNNGGPTTTRALINGSPAIDGGALTGCASTDQRGKTRPKDGDGNGVARCDIGAFEKQTS